MTKSKSKITLTIRLVTGDLLEVKFSRNTTADQLHRSIVQHLNIEERSWKFVLHTDKERTVLKGDERLVDCLENTRDAYLSLEPMLVGG